MPILYPSSDHFPVVGAALFGRIKRNKMKKVKTRSLKRENSQRFGKELNTIDFSVLMDIKMTLLVHLIV